MKISRVKVAILCVIYSHMEVLGNTARLKFITILINNGVGNEDAKLLFPLKRVKLLTRQSRETNPRTAE